MDEFREFSMGLLNSFVQFDSARYAGVMLTQQGMQVEDFFLRNKPVEAITDYAMITHADPVLRALRSNPNRLIRFHPPTLFAGKGNRPLFDYAKQFEHANGMAALCIDQDTLHAQSLSIISRRRRQPPPGKR